MTDPEQGMRSCSEGFRTIWLAADGSVRIIDQRRLPHDYVVAGLETWQDGYTAIADMLVRGAADELGVAGIRVNSVCPGLVDTDIAQGLFGTEDVHQDYLECMPLGRTGVVSDIAHAVRFLCGPESSWITGVNLPVDGGHHLRRGPNYDTFSKAMFGEDITAGRFESLE